jgi:hypothetical protein
MLSNNSGSNSSNKPSEPQASPLSATGAADPVPCLNPSDPIEVASGGNGTINDPSGKDNKPPGVYASDSALA